MSVAQEPTIYPHDLLTHWPAQHNANEGAWWAVYTRSRQELALAGELMRYKIPFYLPLIPRDRVIKGRQSPPLIPLFGRYVFVLGTVDKMLMTLKTNRISRILPVADQDELGRDLCQIRRLIATDLPLRVEERLRTGQTARITAGRLRDLEGTIFRRRGRQRLLIAVSFLKQGVSIEVDETLFELK